MRDYLLICKIAWSFHRTTGLEFEELLSEAILAYLEALPKYNPKRGKLSTFMSRIMQQALVDYYKREKQYTSISNVEYLDDFIPEYEFFPPSLPDDLQHIIDTIQYGEEDYSQLLPKFARGALIKVLRDDGWSWGRIWNNIRKMKLCINEIHI